MPDQDNETDYNKMTEPQKRDYEANHFENLSAEKKFEVAKRDFESGKEPTGERAVIIDRAYGNGDGVFDDKDRQKIQDDRNDKAFMDGIGKATTVMAETAYMAAYDTGAFQATGSFVQPQSAAAVQGSNGFQLGQGGALTGIFANSANQPPQSALGNSLSNNLSGPPQSAVGNVVSGVGPITPALNGFTP